ncbi:MAG: hypothetical protein LIR50_02385 [Bacillota bacterium]|nr:hypothetical protein [Bacillota bacterium]
MPIMDVFKKLFGSKEELSEDNVEEKEVLEINEEDKVVAALAASIMASKNNPESSFHISKITRIK